MKLEFSREFSNKCWNIIHENPSSGSRVVPCRPTDGQTNMTNLIVTLHNFASKTDMMIQIVTLVIIWWRWYVWFHTEKTCPDQLIFYDATYSDNYSASVLRDSIVRTICVYTRARAAVCVCVYVRAWASRRLTLKGPN